jgi:RNA polymerase sigma-70 factor (ECF subfamily)
MQRDLVERAMAGDHDAFAELARVSIRKLLVVARLILRDHARAEDATQEALVTAWTHLSALRDPDRFEAWLQRLLIHACYTEARRDRRRGSIEVHVAEFQMPQAIGAGDMAVDLARRDQLERGFRHLDTDQRTILVLHFYLGQTLDETAAVLGIPPGTVRSRLYRAMSAMRAGLEADARSPLINEGRPA